MVLHFNHTLENSLERIKHDGRHFKFPINNLESYGDAKWAVVDLLNDNFDFDFPINLYNWLHFKEEDEVAYFLNEAGSNTMNYSDKKMPSNICLWMGKRGFIISVEQEGNGFNAIEVEEKGIKQNEGAAFNFFRKCLSRIYFDTAENAKKVYMERII